MVVDNSISLVGGRNVGDQYFQIDPESQFADDDVFAAGPVVKQLSATFDEFWNCALAIPARGLTKGKTSDAALARFRESLAGQPAQIKAGGIDYANRISSGEPLTSMLSGKLPLIWARAQLVYDTPDKKSVDKGEIIGKLMHKPVAVAVAAVQSELLMITPYLIPGDEGMQLFADLRKRNVTVRVLTSSLESSTVLLAQSGYMRYRVPLLEMGVGLYEVRSLLGNSRGSGQTANISRFGNYSLHAKLFVLDRQRLFVGSMNFDQRSMHLNTEIGLIIDSPELAQQAATRFAAMVSPPNAYEVLLQPRGNGRSPQLVWRTQEAGQPVDYDREPARTNAQRLEVKLLSVVAIDKEL
jgi:putative cardiolipin synthase